MQRKQMLGEALYMKIALMQEEELAGKIMDMLLELEEDEVMNLLDSQKAFTNKVNEAITALNNCAVTEATHA